MAFSVFEAYVDHTEGMRIPSYDESTSHSQAGTQLVIPVEAKASLLCAMAAKHRAQSGTYGMQP